MTRGPQKSRRPDAAGPETTNVLLAGVGGQGVLVASEALALTALQEGLEAKQSEVHGVAQRGGSVVSHVRFGPRVYSPLIPCGEVDVLYAAERLEAVRYAHYLKPGGAVVMSNHVIKPIQLVDQEEKPYPDDVVDFLRGKGYVVSPVAALEAAIELGDKRCANVVLLGVLATRLSLTGESWQHALASRFPEKILDLNRRAFAEGQRLAAAAQNLTA